jgi:3-hydroxyacyl-[acyl-carrier-protein] dehydratase
MSKEEILLQLPYSEPFLFVDEILEIDADSIKGTFTYSAALDFYKGHFKDFPVTPGVILTETMAQIGLVSFGIYLSGDSANELSGQVVLTSTQIDFLKPVYPGEKVTVQASKNYFRFNKLSCNVTMLNSANEVVCKGIIAGMIRKESYGQ